ncbi:mechanosensitive ion channel [Alteromonadaceae bacterium M269]|jgi:small-conductance mechanosensitive channel|nr:mechanosensitive ion channel [Alteromonadaceae bacterium M269]
MTENNWLHELNQWAFTYATNLFWSLAILLLYAIITKLALPKIQKSVDKSNLKSEATQKAYHTVRLLAATLTLAILLIVWGIDFSGLLILSTSLITLTGVALFASWSLLSNITSYFILLFQNSYRRGNFVRIIDADNYVEGYIADVNLFNTKLITEDREIIIYPNNLILNRPTVVNPRERLSKMGKVSDKPEIKSKGNE